MALDAMAVRSMVVGPMVVGTMVAGSMVVERRPRFKMRNGEPKNGRFSFDTHRHRVL
jgi:hypothetical protein